MKNEKGEVISAHHRIPLKKFRGKSQFLFSGSAKETDIHQDYKMIEDSLTFLIDLRQFTKGLGLSIHVCDYWNVNRTMKIFGDKPHHQAFVYWKYDHKVVVIAFDN